MSSEWVIGGLLAYVFIREIFFLYSTNKLINKVMSHNYHDYVQSNRASKSDKTNLKPVPDEPEDLGSLTEIG